MLRLADSYGQQKLCCSREALLTARYAARRTPTMNDPTESSASLRGSTIGGQSNTGRSPKTQIALFGTSEAECERNYEAALTRYYEHGFKVDHDLMLYWFHRWEMEHCKYSETPTKSANVLVSRGEQEAKPGD